MSSGATSSGSRDVPVVRSRDRPAPVNAAAYQRKYTTLTRPKTKPFPLGGGVSRTHSFQAGQNRFSQSEFSAFKVPAVPRFLQKESHPNKFLTSTPSATAREGGSASLTASVFRPLPNNNNNNNTGVQLTRNNSYYLNAAGGNRSGRNLPPDPAARRRLSLADSKSRSPENGPHGSKFFLNSSGSLYCTVDTAFVAPTNAAILGERFPCRLSIFPVYQRTFKTDNISVKECKIDRHTKAF